MVVREFHGKMIGLLPVDHVIYSELPLYTNPTEQKEPLPQMNDLLWTGTENAPEHISPEINAKANALCNRPPITISKNIFIKEWEELAPSQPKPKVTYDNVNKILETVKPANYKD